MYKYVICDDNKNIKREIWSCVRAEYLYSTEDNVVLIQITCYKFKKLIVISKIATRK